MSLIPPERLFYSEKRDACVWDMCVTAKAEARSTTPSAEQEISELIRTILSKAFEGLQGKWNQEYAADSSMLQQFAEDFGGIRVYHRSGTLEKRIRAILQANLNQQGKANTPDSSEE